VPPTRSVRTECPDHGHTQFVLSGEAQLVLGASVGGGCSAFGVPAVKRTMRNTAATSTIPPAINAMVFLLLTRRRLADTRVGAGPRRTLAA